MTGGEASEVGISLKSAGVVCKHLNKEKYNVFKVVIEGNDWIVERDNPVKLKIDKNDFSFTIEGHKINFDAVFLAIHGTPAEDGKLQGYFDLLKIPYNACGVLQAALTFDKLKTKEYLAPFGIRTAKARRICLYKTRNCPAAFCKTQYKWFKLRGVESNTGRRAFARHWKRF